MSLALSWVLLFFLILGNVKGSPQFEFNIQDFGADPTTKNDSSPAFQQAVLKAQAVSPQGGGIVIIPPGNFLLLSTVIVNFTLRIEGVTPQSSMFTLNGPNGTYGLSIEGARGVVVNNIGMISQVPGNNGGIAFLNSFIVSVQNIQLSWNFIGILIHSTGNLDVNSINIWHQTFCGIRLIDLNGDDFFSNIHTNNVPSKTGIGMYFSNVSGAKVINSDFIGGAQGVLMDLESTAPNPSNEWVQFTSVDCDTVNNDPWHIVSAMGLQMSETWSGSFLNGTGVWLGPDAKEVSIVNHQCQTGIVCIGNNSPSVSITGGIIGNVKTPVDSSVKGQPVMSNVAIYPIQ